MPGFSRLRMHSKGSIPVAFVEFNNAACAGSAMTTLQGTYLLSSDRGAIRIEYAKSRMAFDIQQQFREVGFIFFFLSYKKKQPKN